MRTRTEMATEKFLAGYNCAQSALHAFGPELGLDGETKEQDLLHKTCLGCVQTVVDIVEGIAAEDAVGR